MYLTIEEFSTRAAESGMVSVEELAAFLQSLPSPPINGQAFAKALVESGKLTQTQAAMIWAGETVGLDELAGSSGELPDIEEEDESSLSVIGGSEPPPVATPLVATPPVASPPSATVHDAASETDQEGKKTISSSDIHAASPKSAEVSVEKQTIQIEEPKVRRKWITLGLLKYTAIGVVLAAALVCILWDQSVAREADRAYGTLLRKIPKTSFLRRSSKNELHQEDVEALIGKTPDGDDEDFEQAVIVAYRWGGIFRDHVVYVLFKKDPYREDEFVFAGVGLNEKPEVRKPKGGR